MNKLTFTIATNIIVEIKFAICVFWKEAPKVGHCGLTHAGLKTKKSVFILVGIALISDLKTGTVRKNVIKLFDHHPF